jgi:cell wall-associated NlpC family hydrolase
MSKVSEEIVDAAQTRLGLPFKHHFKPENLCEFGQITINSCMDKGMDDDGYDCSGLVIASICDVIGIEASNWPADYRHLHQLKSLEEENLEPNSGDVLLFYQKPPRTHMGIFITRKTVIHASGISRLVEKGTVEGDIERVGVIPVKRLLGLLE